MPISGIKDPESHQLVYLIFFASFYHSDRQSVGRQFVDIKSASRDEYYSAVAKVKRNSLWVFMYLFQELTQASHSLFTVIGTCFLFGRTGCARARWKWKARKGRYHWGQTGSHWWAWIIFSLVLRIFAQSSFGRCDCSHRNLELFAHWSAAAPWVW